MRLIVIGAGNWGTVLASEFAHSMDTTLWTRSHGQAEEMRCTMENHKYLPGIKLHSDLKIEPAFSSTIQPEDWILVVVPSATMVDLCTELKSRVHPGQVVINATKGLLVDTMVTMGQLIQRELPQVCLATLTGPTIAREIAEGIPARAVLSCTDLGVLLQLKKKLHSPHLSFSMSMDVEGAELCAALKGMVAIACGLADGFGFATNIQGAIMTAGLREFGVIASFLQVPEKTIYGLSGLGDLFTTCISPNSRNRRFGKLLAEGHSLEDTLTRVGMVVEGVSMAKTIVEFTHFNLDIPLFKFVADMIFDTPSDPKADMIHLIEGVS